MQKKKRRLSLMKQKLTVADGTKAYVKLRHEVIQAGILDRSYAYYTILALISITGYFSCLYLLFVLQSPAQIILIGVLFTIFAVQIGGFLHDASHKAIMKSTRLNYVIGYISGALIVISFGNWLVRHNTHHASPNTEDDPDVDIPVLSFTKERFLSKKGLQRFLVKYQAYLYYPILCLGTLAQRVGDYKFLIAQRGNKKYLFETAIFLTGLFLWFVLPFFIFSLSKALLIFFVVNLSTGFYMANIFAPNHKGMPEIGKHVKISFLERQVMTARNITPTWLTDFLYIGLNLQIEHHLFPNCPRNKLREITPYLLEICRRMKLDYTQMSILESNKIILSELKQISETSYRN